MGEEVRNMPHPVFGRQEKNVLALGCSSVSSGSDLGVNQNRRQTNAGKDKSFGDVHWIIGLQ